MPSGYFSLLCCRNFLSITLYSIHLSISVYQNVFFTLFLGLLTIWGIDTLCHRAGNQTFLWIGGKSDCCRRVSRRLAFTDRLRLQRHHPDPVTLPVPRDQKFLCTLVSCLSLLWKPPCLPGFIPINLYNGKGISLKYFFYLFYPVHLLVYGLILHFCFLNYGVKPEQLSPNDNCTGFYLFSPKHKT